MVKSLCYLILRELQIALRNHFFTIIFFLALIYLVGIIFVIPGEIVWEPPIYFADFTGDDVVKNFLQNYNGRVEELATEERVYTKVTEENYAWGIVAKEGLRTPQIQYVFQGWEDSKFKKMKVAVLADYMGREYLASEDNWSLEKIKEVSINKPPFNLFLLPVTIFSEVFMIGMFFIAALIFIEKDEGTFRAFLITPVKIWQYLVAKIFLMAVIALFFTLLLLVPTIGWGANYGQIILLIILASTFTSLLGLLLASYYKNLSQFLFSAILVLGFITIPSISYFLPSFSPGFMVMLPTYDFIFALRQGIFNLGQEGSVAIGMLKLLIYDGLLFFLAVIRFSQREVSS